MLDIQFHHLLRLELTELFTLEMLIEGFMHYIQMVLKNGIMILMLIFGETLLLAMMEQYTLGLGIITYMLYIQTELYDGNFLLEIT